jgi:ankyrin repeat protein
MTRSSTAGIAGSTGILLVFLAGVIAWPQAGDAQTPPRAAEIAHYDELFSAVVEQDEGRLEQLLKSASNIDRRDAHGRSALHVAAYFRNHQALRKLVAAGADPNALESDYYDIVTIAAVTNDLETMKLALRLGCRADNVTSHYQGTALIAAAHLGHVEIVESLIRAGAPLDHVNNLKWTALIESIVLGDGGPRHTATLRALVDAGANVNLADGRGSTPLQLARGHNYSEMVDILSAAGAR